MTTVRTAKTMTKTTVAAAAAATTTTAVMTLWQQKAKKVGPVPG